MPASTPAPQPPQPQAPPVVTVGDASRAAVDLSSAIAASPASSTTLTVPPVDREPSLSPWQELGPRSTPQPVSLSNTSSSAAAPPFPLATSPASDARGPAQGSAAAGPSSLTPPSLTAARLAAPAASAQVPQLQPPGGSGTASAPPVGVDDQRRSSSASTGSMAPPAARDAVLPDIPASSTDLAGRADVLPSTSRAAASGDPRNPVPLNAAAAAPAPNIHGAGAHGNQPDSEGGQDSPSSSDGSSLTHHPFLLPAVKPSRRSRRGCINPHLYPWPDHLAWPLPQPRSEVGLDVPANGIS